MATSSSIFAYHYSHHRKSGCTDVVQYRKPTDVDVLARDETKIENRAQRRDLQRTPSKANGTRCNDWQEVQRCEVACNAAGDIDECREQQRVGRELDVN